MKKKMLSILILLIILPNFSLFANNNDSTIVNTKTIPVVEYTTSLKEFIVPVSLITAGVIATSTNNNDIISWDRSGKQYKDSSWEYVMFAGVAGSMFAFDTFIKAEHNAFDQSALLLLSAGLSAGSAYIIKESYNSERPDGGLNSFPSGHTTVGFMVAHILNKEFRNSNKWIAYGGYAIASAVGISRIARNKHWVCDVLTGAGLGILGTELAYLIYFPIRNKIANHINGKHTQNLTFMPSVSSESIGVNLSIRF
ncbi:hypothetical protein M2138_002052 [Dysgonomonadaceae bacterium PH5-43]|nr:hypothetical protein [Dysgonomonadaceae bacterium PH5-43]